MPKISDSKVKTRTKKAKKPLRAKVESPFDIQFLLDSKVNIKTTYSAELSIYNQIMRKHEKKQIKVCKRWRAGDGKLSGFYTFLQDMKSRPFNRYMLSCIDESKPYGPGNCQWVVNNKRRNILSFDPGVQNFGVCWIKNRRIFEGFVLKNTLEYVRQETFDNDVAYFKREIEHVIDSRRPNAIVVERFVPRRFSTGHAEPINAMIGVLIAVCSQRGIPLYLIMSSTWKTALKKHIKIEDLYKEAKIALKLSKLMPHTVDASLLGHYFLSDRKFDENVVKWFRANVKRLRERA